MTTKQHDHKREYPNTDLFGMLWEEEEEEGRGWESNFCAQIPAASSPLLEACRGMTDALTTFFCCCCFSCCYCIFRVPSRRYHHLARTLTHKGLRAFSSAPSKPSVRGHRGIESTEGGGCSRRPRRIPMEGNDQRPAAPAPMPPSPWISPIPQGGGGSSDRSGGGGKRKRPETAVAAAAGVGVDDDAAAPSRDPSGDVSRADGGGTAAISRAPGAATSAAADGSTADVEMTPVAPLSPTPPTAISGGRGSGSGSGGGDRPSKIPRREANHSESVSRGASAGGPSGADTAVAAGAGAEVAMPQVPAPAAVAQRSRGRVEEPRRPGRGKGRGSSDGRGVSSIMQEEEEIPEEEEQLQRPGKMPRRGGSAPVLSRYAAGGGAGSAGSGGGGGSGGVLLDGSASQKQAVLMRAMAAHAGRPQRQAPALAPPATDAASPAAVGAAAAAAATPAPRVTRGRGWQEGIDVVGGGVAPGRAAGVESDGGGGGGGDDGGIGTNAVVVRGEDGAGSDGGSAAPASPAAAGVLAVGGSTAEAAAAAAARVPSGEAEEDGSDGAVGGGEVGFPASPNAEGLTGDDFQCNICWELLARPVTLACGHTACESCMAKYLRAQAQAQAQIGNLRVNRIACPAGEKKHAEFVGVVGVLAAVAVLVGSAIVSVAGRKRKMGARRVISCRKCEGVSSVADGKDWSCCVWTIGNHRPASMSAGTASVLFPHSCGSAVAAVAAVPFDAVGDKVDVQIFAQV